MDFYLLDEKNFYQEFNKTRKCKFCLQEYKLKNTFGKLQCSYHFSNFDHKNKTYGCCKRPSYAKECTRCDHHDQPYFSKEEEKIDSKYFYAEGDETPYLTLPKDFGAEQIEETGQVLFKVKVVDRSKFINQYDN